MDNSEYKRTEFILSQESFSRFLSWLDPNPERAGRKYEEIRRKLIKIFACRGHLEAEDLADETINRVIRKAQDVIDSYAGDPALYFYGVARNVHLEHIRKVPTPVPPSSDVNESPKDTEFQCLERCMENLSPKNRDLVLQYYQEEKLAKIDHRKEMAERLGIAPAALRIRMHRIRSALQNCIQECLKTHNG